jgi:hypothetical protein
MIKAKLNDGTVILGLSEENIKRLKEGQPIKFDGRPLGFPGTVGIVYGETEIAILHDLQQAEGGAETRQ